MDQVSTKILPLASAITLLEANGFGDDAKGLDVAPGADPFI